MISLSTDQHDAFQRDGFIVIRGLLSDADIERFFSQIGAVFDVVLRNIGLDPASFPSIDDKYAALKEHRPAMKSRAYDLLKNIEMVWSVAARAPLLDAVRDLAGDEVLLDNAQVRIDEPSNERALPYHQESGQLSEHAITVWVALRDTGVAQGTLGLVPGSHKFGRLPSRRYADMLGEYGVDPEAFNLSAVVPFPVGRGDAILFTAHLVHGTYPMTDGERIRWTYVVRYSDLGGIPYLRNETAPLKVPKENPAG